MLMCVLCFNDTATTEIYPLPLHDALPISDAWQMGLRELIHDLPAFLTLNTPQVLRGMSQVEARHPKAPHYYLAILGVDPRSEEHTSELQSRQYLVCRLLLEKKRLEQASAP